LTSQFDVAVASLSNDDTKIMAFINYDSYAHFSEIHYETVVMSSSLVMRVKNAAYKVT